MIKRKRWLTLVELLIVIALIGMIGGALAYNLGGGLKKGREFRAEQGKKKLKNILYYEIYENNQDPQSVIDDWHFYVENSSLRERSTPLKDIIEDGFGHEYEVEYNSENGEIEVYSNHN